MSAPDRDLQALVVDWGGVLTTSLGETMAAWTQADGIDHDRFRHVMREWLGREAAGEAVVNPVHLLERGEMQVPDFERELASRLSEAGGTPVRPEGLLARMFAGFEVVPPMLEVVRAARRSGLRTALLSNSWGNDYPREGWDEVFDEVVISGEVGMRKPDAEIYLLTASRLGVPPAACVMVDDLAPNVRGAVAAGMVGVLHRSTEETLAELEAVFARPLR